MVGSDIGCIQSCSGVCAIQETLISHTRPPCRPHLPESLTIQREIYPQEVGSPTSSQVNARDVSCIQLAFKVFTTIFTLAKVCAVRSRLREEQQNIRRRTPRRGDKRYSYLKGLSPSISFIPYAGKSRRQMYFLSAEKRGYTRYSFVCFCLFICLFVHLLPHSFIHSSIRA